MLNFIPYPNYLINPLVSILYGFTGFTIETIEKNSLELEGSTV